MGTEGDKRIVIVTSDVAHMSGVWDPNNLQGDNGYDRFKFYGNSKLYNVWYIKQCYALIHCVFVVVDHDSICTAEEGN